MTEKQRLFATVYIISNNPAFAYMQAYPGCKNKTTAEKKGLALLENDEIKKMIEQSESIDEFRAKAHNEAKFSDKSIAKEEEVMAYLTSVMRGEEKDEIAIRTGRDCQEIAQIKPDTKDRMKAAELLAKRYGLSEEKGKDGGAEVIIREDLE